MKHTLRVTLALVAFFFLAQIVGLVIVNQYIDHKKTVEAKEIVYKPLPYDLERPQVEDQSTSFLYVFIPILVGTAMLFLIIKANKPIIWKIIYFISVVSTLTIAFSAFMSQLAAGILALILGILKLYKPSVIIQNSTEIFIYGGLAAFVVNIFNLFSVFMLLILISIYDFIAVYKTKHMVKLAEFQSNSKIFAGLFIPYERGRVSMASKISGKFPLKKPGKFSKAPSEKSVAVLGGGDIGFTLIFAGVVMKALMLQDTFLVGFLKALIIPVFATAALFILLMKGQQNKFYPAMPVLSLGCFVGFLVVWLV